MASKNTSRRWVVLVLVALGVVVAATLPRSGSDEPAQEQEPEPNEAREATPQQAGPSDRRSDGGKASRRIAEGCDQVEESLKYEDFTGRRAHAILSWNGMSDRSANLKIPVHVVGIEDGSVGVRFMQFPMREQYLGIWLGSGHIKPGPDDVFLLDPCSATVVAWPQMEGAGATDDDALDEDGFVKDEFLDSE